MSIEFRLFNSPFDWSSLIIDSNVSQSVIAIFIDEPVNHLVPLTKAKDWPCDIVFVFLFQTVLKNLLCCFVVLMLCAVRQDHRQTSTREVDTVYLV